MAVAKYNLKVDDYHLTFEFVSEEPKGKIHKIVQYTEIYDEGNLYNLGFGDWDSETKDIDDTVVSNNGDGEKVLNTVAYTILEFTRIYPNAVIYVTGSTNIRTRAYRIGIRRNLELIGESFEVKGRDKEGRWVSFKENIEYDAFLIKRKNT